MFSGNIADIGKQRTAFYPCKVPVFSPVDIPLLSPAADPQPSVFDAGNSDIVCTGGRRFYVNSIAGLFVQGKPVFFPDQREITADG